MRQQFLNSPEDVEWLRSTHLAGRTDLVFESFVLIGNEDAPDEVHLYADADPLYTDTPHVITFPRRPLGRRVAR